MKYLLCLLCLMFSMGAYADEKPNIIFMIGDGMGPAYTSAYRYYQDNPDTQAVETTIFDELLVGMSSTYPDDKPGTITDSAAAATALATGVKTYNGAIGIAPDKRPRKTMLEMAKEHGYQTALVVTSQINHATPAAFAAHIDSREKYNEIADQYIDARINGRPKVDLMFGGGRKFFNRADRNIVAEFEALGYTSVSRMQDLGKIHSLPAIALMGDVGMASALDSEDKFRLATMTDKALSLMGSKPFFMMIEGSQIDWCGHDNDIACAMAEMNDFAETIKRVRKFIDRNPNTVLVITADHSTGGLSMGADGKYLWLTPVIKKLKATGRTIVSRLLKNRDHWQSEWEAVTGFSLNTEEQQMLQATIDQVTFAADAAPDTLGKAEYGLLVKLHGLVVKAVDKRSVTGWTTGGHTGVDVQVFSYGKYAAEFSGHMDNTDIAKKLMAHIK